MNALVLKILAVGLLFLIIIIGGFHVRNKNRIPKLTSVPWLLEPRRAMTIPPFGIFVRKEYLPVEPWFSAHEEYHWKQYQRLGLFGFYFTYYKGMILRGYFNNPLELEAREKGGWKKSDRTDAY